MTTLLAVTGLSPAIVTETIWALAKKKPRLLPDRVAFITTATGAAIIEAQLFTPRPDWGDLSVWDSLRKSLKAKPGQLIAEPPQIISLPDPTSGRSILLDDIRSPAENAAAAEFIFARVWDIVRDKDRSLVASIAGGRKTVGALLHSAVSLIGREHDLITHVLVSAPFDSLTDFFYPAQPACPLHDSGSGRAFLAAAAEVTLAEVPFVPLRNRFKELDDLPCSFLSLRHTLAKRLAHDAERPVAIRIEHSRQRAVIDGMPCKLRPKALAVLEFILRCDEKKQTFTGHAKAPQELAAEAFTKWHAKHSDRLAVPTSPGGFVARDLTKELSHLRDKCKSAGWQPAKQSFVQAPFRLEVVS